jgi:hypothetical protein
MEKKKVIIIAISVLLVISALVGAVMFITKKDNTKVPETSKIVNTEEINKNELTTKEDKTTTTKKEVITEKESAKESETVTKVTQTITKAPETTKKPATNSPGNSGGSSTTTPKPTTTAPATQKQEITTQKPIISNTTTVNQTESVDISVVGNIKYGDMARAGLVYTDDGKLSTYEEIEHGDWYYHYDKNGNRRHFQKPVKNGTETNFDCQYCGKSTLDRWDKFANCTPACAIGGCTRWTSDVTCQHCGIFVIANTCHTCQ